MSSRTKSRTARGWDVAVVAVILAVVWLGWLIPLGGGGAAHSGRPVVQARLSGPARPGRDGTGSFSVAPRPRGGNGGAVARHRRVRR
jgi:hypothetical protein